MASRSASSGILIVVFMMAGWEQAGTLSSRLPPPELHPQRRAVKPIALPQSIAQVAHVRIPQRRRITRHEDERRKAGPAAATRSRAWACDRDAPAAVNQPRRP